MYRYVRFLQVVRKFEIDLSINWWDSFFIKDVSSNHWVSMLLVFATDRMLESASLWSSKRDILFSFLGKSDKRRSFTCCPDAYPEKCLKYLYLRLWSLCLASALEYVSQFKAIHWTKEPRTYPLWAQSLTIDISVKMLSHELIFVMTCWTLWSSQHPLIRISVWSLSLS